MFKSILSILPVSIRNFVQEKIWDVDHKVTKHIFKISDNVVLSKDVGPIRKGSRGMVVNFKYPSTLILYMIEGTPVTNLLEVSAQDVHKEEK